MTKDEIVYDDFAKIEMRIGEIKEVLPFPRARNPSYKVCVSFGDLGGKVVIGPDHQLFRGRIGWPSGCLRREHAGPQHCRVHVGNSDPGRAE